MRADLYLAQYGHASSRTLAQKLIADGAVMVDGRILKKASEEISEGEHTVTVASTDDTRYVGRGGLKLECELRPCGCVRAVVLNINAVKLSRILAVNIDLNSCLLVGIYSDRIIFKSKVVPLALL